MLSFSGCLLFPAVLPTPTPTPFCRLASSGLATQPTSSPRVLVPRFFPVASLRVPHPHPVPSEASFQYPICSIAYMHRTCADSMHQFRYLASHNGSSARKRATEVTMGIFSHFTYAEIHKRLFAGNATSTALPGLRGVPPGYYGFRCSVPPRCLEAQSTACCFGYYACQSEAMRNLRPGSERVNRGA